MSNNKTIVCFDIESTGLDTQKDSIIQISMVKFDKKTYEIVSEYSSYVQPEGDYTIGIGAYLKHGISPEFLKDKPYFVDIATEVFDFMNDSDILGYNCISFDMKILSTEFNRVGLTFDFLNRDIYDSFLEEKRRHPNTLEGVYARYNDGKSMEENGLQAHDAMSDVKATINVFKHQQDENEFDAETLITEDNAIANQMFGDSEAVCFTIGKYKGIPISYVAKNDRGYLAWATGPKCNFCKNTKDYINSYLASE